MKSISVAVFVLFFVFLVLSAQGKALSFVAAPPQLPKGKPEAVKQCWLNTSVPGSWRDIWMEGSEKGVYEKVAVCFPGGAGNCTSIIRIAVPCPQ